MEKTCDNCVYKVVTGVCFGILDKPNCSEWKYYKAHCLNCLYLEQCSMLGKEVSEKNVCGNHKRDKSKPVNPSKPSKKKKTKVKEEPKPKKSSKKKAAKASKDTPSTPPQETSKPTKVKKKKKSKDTTKKQNAKATTNKAPAYLPSLPSKEQEDKFSPEDLVDQVIKSGYDSKAFTLIDDKQVPWADNPVRFIYRPEFLNMELFPRQMKYAMEFFSAYCPYCSDTKFIDNIKVDTPIGNIMDRTVLYSDGMCPSCGSTRYEAILDGDHNNYNQLIGCAGQRSGKSIFTSVLAATVTHQYLKLGDPIKHFNLTQNTNLHGTFVALRYTDAVDLLWDPYHHLIKQSPWFQTYHHFLDEEANRLGMELYKDRDTFLTYPFKRIAVYPAGPDKRKLRGKTRFMAAIDEIGWFMGSDGNVKYDADEVYAALDNSLLTVLAASKKVIKQVPDTPTACGFYISSPSSKMDKSMRLYKTSKVSKTLYGFHAPTWEINPNITKDDLAPKYAEDPVVAERDFGANPPFSANPYIKDVNSLLPCFDGKRNIFKVNGYGVTRDSLNKRLMYPKIKFLARHDYPSCLSIDCAYNNNSFALTLVHYLPDRNDNMRLACSGLIEIVPQPHALSYPKIYQHVISPILSTYNVQMVAFDRWQSINLSQQIYEDFEIDAIQHSVNMDAFNDLRQRVYSEEVQFPKLETDIDNIIAMENVENLIHGKPVTHAFLQFLLSKDTGRTVTKGDEATDDILRAFVLGATIVSDEDLEDIFSFYGSETNSQYNDISKVVKVASRLTGPAVNMSPGGGTNQASGVGVCASRPIAINSGGGVF